MKNKPTNGITNIIKSTMLLIVLTIIISGCQIERHGRVYDKIYEEPYVEDIGGTSFAGKVPNTTSYERYVGAKYFITMIIIKDRDTIYRDLYVDKYIYDYFSIGDSISFNWISGFKKY